MSRTDTIYALATAPGRAGVAMFRISGPLAANAITRLCRPALLPCAREATLRSLYQPDTETMIDRALVIYFEAPQSFTGENVAEFHLHGGRAVTHAVTAALSALPGFRLAEPGEFTRRAFENGKMDLTEAEAIADLVDAETEAQRRQALRQMEGALGHLYENWRSRLLTTLAYFEASIDFSDEDLPKDLTEKRSEDLRALASEITVHLDDSHRGERLRDGFSVAILGAPNAGKSSLLNALARRDAAIVSSTAGTTRDVIEVHLDLGGYPVILADTAGLRESSDSIENEGVRRALHRARHADMKILVFDAAQDPAFDEATCKLFDEHAILVLNKADVLTGQKIAQEFPGRVPPLVISAQTGEGIPALLERLIRDIDLRFSETGSAPLTRARHRESLEDCLSHLKRSLDVAAFELRAEDTRLAMRALGRITGRVDVEDLLDVIFRDFCIGK